MNLDTIFGLANIDKILEIFFGITSAILSPASLIVLWVLVLLGGVMLFFEFMVERMYNRYITDGRVTVDKDLKVPVQVGVEGERPVVLPETVEYLEQESKTLLDDTPEYVDYNHTMVNILNGVLFVLTLPVSLVMYLLVYFFAKSLMSKGDLVIATKMLRISEWSSKVTGVLKWLWTTLFIFILAVIFLIVFVILIVYIASKYMPD